MAKKKEPSLRSREARRRVSVSPEPDLGLDASTSRSKSELDSGKALVQEKVAKMSVRGQDLPLAHRGMAGIGGVSKTKKKTLSAKQKKRRLEAMEKAEAINDMLQTKVSNSQQKGQLIKERKKE